MAALLVNLSSIGQPAAGTAIIVYGTNYDAKTNRTVVNFEKCSVYYRGQGTIATGLVSISVKANDNEGSGASSRISRSNISSHFFEAVPQPKSVIVGHGYDEVEKFITISADVSLFVTGPSAGSVSGSKSEIIETGLASIVHVGDKVGSLYIAEYGKWHIGLLHVSKDGKFQPGIGHIPITPTVTYDEEGNVYLSGVGMTHDNAGNVLLSGVTATDDGDGNITIT